MNKSIHAAIAFAFAASAVQAASVLTEFQTTPTHSYSGGKCTDEWRFNETGETISIVNDSSLTMTINAPTGTKMSVSHACDLTVDVHLSSIVNVGGDAPNATGTLTFLGLEGTAPSMAPVYNFVGHTSHSGSPDTIQMWFESNVQSSSSWSFSGIRLDIAFDTPPVTLASTDYHYQTDWAPIIFGYSAGSDAGTFTQIVAVPEPHTAGIMLLMGAFAIIRRRRG